MEYRLLKAEKIQKLRVKIAELNEELKDLKESFDIRDGHLGLDTGSLVATNEESLTGDGVYLGYIREIDFEIVEWDCFNPETGKIKICAMDRPYLLRPATEKEKKLILTKTRGRRFTN